MRRINIYLSIRTRSFLNDEADRQGVSKSEVIRGLIVDAEQKYQRQFRRRRTSTNKTEVQ